MFQRINEVLKARGRLKIVLLRCERKRWTTLQIKFRQKTGKEMALFWSETGSGFGEQGGTPPPRIVRCTPRGSQGELRLQLIF